MWQECLSVPPWLEGGAGATELVLSGCELPGSASLLAGTFSYQVKTQGSCFPACIVTNMLERGAPSARFLSGPNEPRPCPPSEPQAGVASYLLLFQVTETWGHYSHRLF